MITAPTAMAAARGRQRLWRWAVANLSCGLAGAEGNNMTLEEEYLDLIKRFLHRDREGEPADPALSERILELALAMGSKRLDQLVQAQMGAADLDEATNKLLDGTRPARR
jgi:hypothetical protein